MKLFFTRILFAAFLGLAFNAQAQFSNCTVSLTTVIDNKPLVLKSSDGILLLNSKSGELTLKVNSGTFASDADTGFAHILQNTNEIIFTGNIQANILQLITQQSNSGKNFPIAGTLNINAVSFETTASYNALKINNERDDLFRNVKMSVFIAFPASSAKLNKTSLAINGDIVIQVIEGATNIITE